MVGPVGKILTGGYQLFVDEQDEDILKYGWCALVDKYTVYAKATIDGEYWLLHRFLLRPRPHQLVDHIDKNGLNCRRKNLRVCDRSQNSSSAKLRCNNPTGYRGVRLLPSGNYFTSIRVKGKRITIGTYSTREEAARAYDRIAKLAYGEFASLNFAERT